MQPTDATGATTILKIRTASPTLVLSIDMRKTEVSNGKHILSCTKIGQIVTS